MNIDYEYLCDNFGHLSGLQTRVYQKKEVMYFNSNAQFEPDLAELVLDRVWQTPHNLSYFDTENLLFFGALKIPEKDIAFVIGPTFRIRVNDRQIISILHAMGQPQERLPELKTYFDNTPPYPLNSFLQILCFLNYALNDEKLTVADLITQQTSLAYIDTELSTDFTPPTSDDINVHNTYRAEQTMLSYIRSGQVATLQTIFAGPPTGQVGKIAHSEMRQHKNTFVCAATLVSRAAIEGGLSQETAFSLSDLYIQKAELLDDYNAITLLNIDMWLEFARRVEQLKCHGSKSRFVTDVARYVQANIDQQLTTTQIAQAMSLSRTHLCERFKSETGVTLNAFITEQKIEEAKRLLRSTDRSIGDIAEYLGFSTQSYFQNVFKKVTGQTPRQFKEDPI